MSYEIVKAIAEGRGDLALVTVVEAEGSAPAVRPLEDARRAGAVSHPFLGTVGGGKGEARAIAEALEAIQQKKPREVTLEFHGVEIEGQDMICGGTSRLLIEPILNRTPYRIASAGIGTGERVLAGRRIPGAEASLVVPVLDEQGAPLHGSLPAPLQADCRARPDSGSPSYRAEEDAFLDPLVPDEKLLVLGGGYVWARPWRGTPPGWISRSRWAMTARKAPRLARPVPRREPRP